MELGKLGTTTDSEGNSTYDPFKNPMLQHDVTGEKKIIGLTPNDFATPQAAAMIAKVVGGSVVPDPEREFMAATAKPLAISLNGLKPNAGNLCMVMGNDPGYANSRIKAFELSKMLGIVPADEQLADKIYDAWVALPQPK